MKFILINGSSCAGKSTVSKNLLKQGDRLFYLSYDSLKWQFSRYAAGKHVEDIRTAMFSLAKTMCRMGYDVICDSLLFHEWRKSLRNLALGYGYEVIEINLEADYEVLSQRFDERVAAALANPESRISNVSKERFKELYDIYEQEKNPQAATIRTDILSSETVMENVIQLCSLRNNHA